MTSATDASTDDRRALRTHAPETARPDRRRHPRRARDRARLRAAGRARPLPADALGADTGRDRDREAERRRSVRPLRSSREATAGRCFGSLVVAYLLYRHRARDPPALFAPLPNFAATWIGGIVAHSITTPFIAAVGVVLYFRLARMSVAGRCRLRRLRSRASRWLSTRRPRSGSSSRSPRRPSARRG